MNRLDYTDKLGIQLWNVDTEELEWTLEGHPNGVLATAISPDGTTLASSGLSGDATIKLWEHTNRQTERHIYRAYEQW